MMLGAILKLFAVAGFVYATLYALTAPRQLVPLAAWLFALSIAAVIAQWTTGPAQGVALIAVGICLIFEVIAAVIVMRAIKKCGGE